MKTFIDKRKSFQYNRDKGVRDTIHREHYIAKLRPFYHSDLVKIITGIRRSGKSVILSEIMQEFIIESVKQYSTKTKRELNFYVKLYNADVVLNSIRCHNNRFALWDMI